MENVIVILNAGDLPGAVQIAQDLPAYTVYVFDPVLVDLAAAKGLQNIEFCHWGNCPVYHQFEPECRAAASALEAKLDLALRDIIPDVSIRSWQHLNLYYLLLSLKWHGALWENEGAKFAGKKVYLFICDNPGYLYFNSFIPSVLLLWYLKRNDIEFSGYTYDTTADQADLMPNLSGTNSDGHLEQILVHLPTCMYDINYFYQEAVATGKTLINLSSKHFDIPLPTHKTIGLVSADTLYATLAEPLQKTVDAFSAQLSPLLEAFFTPLLEISGYRARQVQQLASLYRAQLISYFEMNRHFETAKPAKILLSDHDAGFHGPLLAFAEKHAVPVRVLPHAKTVNHLEFTYGNIAVMTHPLQGEEIFDATGKSVPTFRLAYPENFSSSSVIKSLKTVSLLLNALSLNGVYFSRYQNYLQGIKQIFAWCQANGIALKVRCKPSYSIINILVRDVGLDHAELMQNMQEPMEQYANACDVCLMYGTPTSGALHFLRNAIPVLNPIVAPLTSMELTMGNASLMPPESMDPTLRRLKGFVSDPASLAAFRNTQFRNYMLLFQDARPLRNFL